MLFVKTIGILLLILAIVGTAFARSASGNQSLLVTFAVDGERVSCPALKITLRFHGQQIVPKLSTQGFIVPAIFKKGPESHNDKVNVTVVCGEHTLEFSDVHPSWVTPGRWEFGIAYPPYWFKPFRFTSAVEHGTWVSYLMSECNDCDPGVYTTVSHDAAPKHAVMALVHEQPNASEERARDIAYSLAVFGEDYQRNRDYLLELLNVCVSKLKVSAEDNVCDGDLLDYITNLYWRGDAELLAPLLEVADDRPDVISEIGYFYGDLLDRRPEAALKGMAELSVEKQQTICALAGKDDFSLDIPKFERAEKHLRAIGTEIALRCLQEATRKVGRTPADGM